MALLMKAMLDWFVVFYWAFRSWGLKTFGIHFYFEIF